jgi:hypothetical protein
MMERGRDDWMASLLSVWRCLDVHDYQLSWEWETSRDPVQDGINIKDFRKHHQKLFSLGGILNCTTYFFHAFSSMKSECNQGKTLLFPSMRKTSPFSALPVMS